MQNATLITENIRLRGEVVVSIDSFYEKYGKWFSPQYDGSKKHEKLVVKKFMVWAASMT